MTSYFASIEWPKPFLELYEFVGLFMALGAIGFRYTALRVVPEDVGAKMSRRAGAIGLIGACLTLIHVVKILPRLAHRAKLPVGEFLTTVSPGAAWFYLTIIAVLGFVAVIAGMRWGWTVATIGIIAGILRNVFTAELIRMVTPMHVLTGGLWIGTLFVLVVAGILSVRTREDRGRIVANMVNAFSPLALTCGLTVLVFGVIAALKELKPLSDLWTTPYGYTLIAKVCVVGIVLALGAWNWRKQRPALGSAESARSIQKSATAELIAAAVVLMITSIMLSLPD